MCIHAKPPKSREIRRLGFASVATATKFPQRSKALSAAPILPPRPELADLWKDLDCSWDNPLFPQQAGFGSRIEQFCFSLSLVPCICIHFNYQSGEFGCKSYNLSELSYVQMYLMFGITTQTDRERGGFASEIKPYKLIKRKINNKYNLSKSTNKQYCSSV